MCQDEAMKIRKREEIDGIQIKKGLSKQADAQTPGTSKAQSSSPQPNSAARVEIAAGEFLNKVAEGPSNSEKVMMLKKIVAEQGVSALNARYASEDVAVSLASELSSFIDDFSERE